MFNNFSVDYNIMDNSNIINIHKYLMKKHDVEYCLNLLKKFIKAIFWIIRHLHNRKFLRVNIIIFITFISH